MGLESATYISELVATNPAGADDYATADDHLRLIKTVLQTQFPNFTADAMVASVVELNYMDGVTSAIQTQLDTKAASAHSHTSGEISALDVSDITTGIFAAAFIPDLNASKITAGTLAAARIPTHTGDVTGQTALTIANNAVSLAKMADIITASFLGRNTAATGDPEVLSAATARSILGIEAGATADQTAGEIEGIVNHDNLGGFVQNEHIRWDLTGVEDIHADRYSSGGYTHPSHPGDDFSVDSTLLSGATVISDIDINVTTDTQGHVTDANGVIATRNLTAANVGAAATSHNHNASDINAGTLVVARGGTGVTAKTGTGNVVLSASPTFTGTVLGAALTFSGQVQGGTLNASSDARLKDNIVAYVPAPLSFLPKMYDLKTGLKNKVGYIAQDVICELPAAVSEDENGMLALDYNMVFVAKIAELEARLAAANL